MGSSGSGIMGKVSSVATGAALGGAIATVATGGMASPLVTGALGIDTGALVGGIMGGTKDVGLPGHDEPNAAQPAQTSQSKDNGHGGADWNMKLSQQLAASAGGTLFSTPTQWMGQQIGNDPNAPRKTLVGA